MLAHILAIAVGLGSFALYMAAFFYPEVYRRNDLIWSGVGLFYALVLWICAGRITGGVLLGQMAGVALLLGLGWQLLELRHEKTPVEQRTEVSPEVQGKLANWLTPLTQLFQQFNPTSPPTATKVEDMGEAVLETPPSKPVTRAEVETPPQPVAKTPSDPPKTVVETPPPTPPKPVVETPAKPPPNPSAKVTETPTEKQVPPSPIKTPTPHRKPSANNAIAMEEIDDFWADDVPQEDISGVPAPAIVTNLEDLTHLDRPMDSWEEEMTQSFENMVSEADLTASEAPKKSE